MLHCGSWISETEAATHRCAVRCGLMRVPAAARLISYSVRRAVVLAVVVALLFAPSCGSRRQITEMRIVSVKANQQVELVNDVKLTCPPGWSGYLVEGPGSPAPPRAGARGAPADEPAEPTVLQDLTLYGPGGAGSGDMAEVIVLLHPRAARARRVAEGRGEVESGALPTTVAPRVVLLLRGTNPATLVAYPAQWSWEGETPRGLAVAAFIDMEGREPMEIHARFKEEGGAVVATGTPERQVKDLLGFLRLAIP